MGSLEGMVTSAARPGDEIFLYLIGTEYYVVLQRPGQYAFPSLPAGVYELQASILSSDTTAVMTIISNSNRKTVTIAPDSRTIADTLGVP